MPKRVAGTVAALSVSLSGLTVLVSLTFFSCSSVPITGRSQLSLIPNSELLSMSYSQYDTLIRSSKLCTDKQKVALVRKVGTNIQHAVEQYFSTHGASDKLTDYRWEYNLIQDDSTVNASCMPGGKVIVYTGILPVTKTEAGLATVLGHEISHAVAQHGAERMSQGMIAQYGGAALNQILASDPEGTRNLAMQAFGMGAEYGVLLPFSRTQESEADHLGLIFMAMAGYDPHEALTFWTRMAQLSAGKAPPEITSTHPSDQTRIDDINKELPEAMTYYKKK